MTEYKIRRKKRSKYVFVAINEIYMLLSWEIKLNAKAFSVIRLQKVAFS